MENNNDLSGLIIDNVKFRLAIKDIKSAIKKLDSISSKTDEYKYYNKQLKQLLLYKITV